MSFSGNEAVASLFSIFFAVVSAYIAGLYFFIYQAPTTLKVIAFGLLTIGFLFIGQAMSGIEIRILGLVEAWDGLASRTTGIEHLNNPVFPLPAKDLLSWAGIEIVPYDGNRAGIYSGWSVSLLVYIALFYATFFYRWPESKGPQGNEGDSRR